MDPRLMRGDDWIRCAICGHLHTPPYDRLAVDTAGVQWDVCQGQCAREAGIECPPA